VIAVCRESDIPILGICLGFQLMVIDWARSSGHPGATSQEFDSEDAHNWVIRLHQDQDASCGMGGTLRKGGYDILANGIESLGIRGVVHQRFRYRYEVNPEWGHFRDASVCFTGFMKDADKKYSRVPNIFHRKGHRFFLGTQSHPEMSSYLSQPSLFFISFVSSIL